MKELSTIELPKKKPKMTKQEREESCVRARIAMMGPDYKPKGAAKKKAAGAVEDAVAKEIVKTKESPIVAKMEAQLNEPKTETQPKTQPEEERGGAVGDSGEGDPGPLTQLWEGAFDAELGTMLNDYAMMEG